MTVQRRTTALVLVALGVAGPVLATFLRRRAAEVAAACDFMDEYHRFEAETGGGTLGEFRDWRLRSIALDLPPTTEHDPACDDDGWDHPGPCVIEVCRECGTPAGEHTAQCGSSPAAVEYASGGLVPPPRGWPAGIVGEPIDVPVFRDGGIVGDSSLIGEQVVVHHGPTIIPELDDMAAIRARQADADYRAMRTRER